MFTFPGSGHRDVVADGSHTFQAWASPAYSTYDVPEAYDQPLHIPELAGATHAPYAFRFQGAGGNPQESFFSDGDTNAGVMMVGIICELSAENLVMLCHIVPQSDQNQANVASRIRHHSGTLWHICEDVIFCKKCIFSITISQ